MCNCMNLKDVFINLSPSLSTPKFNYQGVEKFSEYFQNIPGEYFHAIDDDDFEPEFDHSIKNYTCKFCGQAWYFEFESGEYPSPEFGMKLRDANEKLNLDDVYASKQFLTILAHDGFEPSRCRSQKCCNLKLKGKEVCHIHGGSL